MSASALSRARVIQVANLQAERPEADGLDGTDHLLSLLEHRVRVDTLLYDPAAPLAVNAAYVYEHGVMAVGAPVATDNRRHHDPRRLATALVDLLA